MKFNCYLKPKVRLIPQHKNVEYGYAYSFLEKSGGTGVVINEQNDIFLTPQELQEHYYVKDIRPDYRAKFNLKDTDSGSVHEDSDRELSGTSDNNSESGSECDN